MVEHVTVADESDIELLVRVRAGDAQASTALLARHRDAVAAVAGHPTYAAHDPVEASGRDALLWASRGVDDLPFRAGWLALHARGALPVARPSDEVVWTAYTALPAAWQLAVWHREVEGDHPRDIARLLGMGEEQAARALASSYAALKRRVALAHAGATTTPACEDIVTTYRFTPPPVLLGADVRELREHGRRCDDCLDLIRNLFRIEHTLRDTLAGVVLGDLADAYLARRPRVARLRVPTGSPVRSVRPVRPVLATLSAAAVGAAAMALVVAHPALSPAPGGPASAVEASVPAPGRTLGPAAPVDPGGGGPSVIGADRSPADGRVLENAAHETPEVTETGAPPEPAPTSPVPVVPVPSPGAPEPQVPGGPPGTPPEGPGPVGVEVSAQQVAVAVDPAPLGEDPVVVSVPVPDPLPVPASLPGVPLAPLASLASLVPGAVVGRVSW